MIAKMSSDGILIVEPENGAEAYALTCWQGGAQLVYSDVARNEPRVYRASRLRVATQYPVVHNISDPA